MCKYTNYKWAVTPLGRGFDDFFGYFQGQEDYYNHTVRGHYNLSEHMEVFGYDFWNGTAVHWNASTASRFHNCSGDADPGCKDPTSHSKYSTHLFTEQAVHVIEQHAKRPLVGGAMQPLFLYLAWQAIHGPIEAPPECIEPFENSGMSGDRLKTAGMIHCMDKGVGEVVSALKEALMWNNTLFIFT